jgi:hypothetical protein
VGVVPRSLSGMGFGGGVTREEGIYQVPKFSNFLND